MLSAINFSKRILNLKLALMTLCLIVLSYYFVDKPLAYFIQAQIERGYLNPFIPSIEKLTHLGDNFLYMALLVLILLFNYLWLNNKVILRLSSYLLVTLIIAIAICLWGKIILGRPRPELLFTKQLYNFQFFQMQNSFWSFPSCHATTIACLMIGLSLWFRRLTPLFLIILFAIASTRMLLNIHYLSDVIAGIYLGSVCACVIYHLLSKRNFYVFKQ